MNTIAQFFWVKNDGCQRYPTHGWGLLHTPSFLINVIISDYKNTTQTVLNHPALGDWGQIPKSPSSFYAFVSHHVKVLMKQDFLIAMTSKAESCRFKNMMTSVVRRIEYIYIYKQQREILGETRKANKVPLKHMVNSINKLINRRWCYNY